MSSMLRDMVQQECEPSSQSQIHCLTEPGLPDFSSSWHHPYNEKCGVGDVQFCILTLTSTSQQLSP